MHWSDWDCGVCTGAGETGVCTGVIGTAVCTGAGETGGWAGVIGTVVCVVELTEQVGWSDWDCDVCTGADETGGLE